MGCISQGQHPKGVPSEALGWPPAPGHHRHPRGWGDTVAGLTLPEEAAALPTPPQKRLHF